MNNSILRDLLELDIRNRVWIWFNSSDCDDDAFELAWIGIREPLKVLAELRLLLRRDHE